MTNWPVPKSTREYRVEWTGVTSVDHDAQIPINNMIASLDEPGEIVLPPYLLHQSAAVVIDRPGVTIRGYGRASRLQCAPGVSPSFHNVIVAADDVTVRDMSAGGVAGQSSPGEASAYHIFDPTGLSGVRNALLQNVHCSEVDTGIRVGYWGKMLIAGSGATPPTSTSVIARDVRISDCVLEDCRRQIIECIMSSDVMISGVRGTMIAQGNYNNTRGLRISGGNRVRMSDSWMTGVTDAAGNYGVQITAGATFTDPAHLSLPTGIVVDNCRFDYFSEFFTLNDLRIGGQITNNDCYGTGQDDPVARTLLRLDARHHNYPTAAYSAHHTGSPIPSTIASTAGWKRKIVGLRFAGNRGYFMPRFMIQQGQIVGGEIESNFVIGTTTPEHAVHIPATLTGHGGDPALEIIRDLVIRNNRIITGYSGSSGAFRFTALRPGSRITLSGNEVATSTLKSEALPEPAAAIVDDGTNEVRGADVFDEWMVDLVSMSRA